MYLNTSPLSDVGFANIYFLNLWFAFHSMVLNFDAVQFINFILLYTLFTKSLPVPRSWRYLLFSESFNV